MSYGMETYHHINSESLPKSFTLNDGVVCSFLSMNEMQN